MATACMENELDKGKQGLLAKITTLDGRAQMLERERGSLFKRGELRSVLSDLEERQHKLEVQRRKEKKDLLQNTTRIRTMVTSFHRMLTNMRPGPSYVEALKKAMEDIESSITVFKEKQKTTFEELLQEEKTLSVEVTAFEKKLDSWTTARPTPSTGTTMTAISRTHQPTIPPAVLAFERFLEQTGGREGGWESLDHQTFVKIHTKLNGQPSFLERAASELPTKTVEDIKQHDQWYTEYCTLLESKKKAIEEWKKKKQASKVVPASTSEDLSAKRVKLKEEQLAKEREERLRKLTEWKTQQAVRQRQEEEAQLKAATEQLKIKQREQKRKDVLKAQVAEYTHEKELAKLAEKERKEDEKRQEEERRRAATKQVERFRERDLRELEARKEKAKKREEEAQERAKALEKTKVEVRAERDPQRLYKLTAGWENRRKASSQAAEGGQEMSLPRRAVPSWRQGL